MHIALEPEQVALREELREYFAELVTPEVQAGLASATGEFGEAGVYKDVIRQIGADGWLGIGWPKEYGGQARSMVEQLIFTDVAAVAGVPIPYLTLNTVGPTIMRFGTRRAEGVLPPQDPRRRAALLDRLLRARLRHRPRVAARPARCREGDEWVINGQKMWTSLIQYADWIWLACRTDPDLPRHKGLSMILVPADAPGVSYTPGAHRGRRRHQRDVLRGRAGAGREPGRRAERRLVADDQPAQPRAGRAHLGRAADPLAADWCGEWAQQTKAPDGQRVIDTEWVQIALGRAHARIEALSLHQLEARRRRRRRRGALPRRGVGDQDLRLRARHRGLPRADGDRRAERRHHRRLRRRRAAGRLERFHRSSLVMTFGGGTNEIQRDIIGYVGLGLPAAEAIRTPIGTTMDFTFTPEQDEAAELAATILKDKTTTARMKGSRRPATGSTATCGRPGRGRAALAGPARGVRRRRPRAGRAVPRAGGGRPDRGAGAAGRPRPAAVLLAESAGPEVAEQWLPGAASGEHVLTAAVAEDRAHLPARPTVTATPSGEGWRSPASKSIVRAGTSAELFLVTASTDEGVGVFLVEPGVPGVELTAQRTSDGDTVARLDLTGAPAQAPRRTRRCGGPPPRRAAHRVCGGRAARRDRGCACR